MLDTAVHLTMQDHPDWVANQICKHLTSLHLWNSLEMVQEFMDELTAGNEPYKDVTMESRIKLVRAEMVI